MICNVFFFLSLSKAIYCLWIRRRLTFCQTLIIHAQHQNYIILSFLMTLSDIFNSGDYLHRKYVLVLGSQLFLLSKLALIFCCWGFCTPDLDGGQISGLFIHQSSLGCENDDTFQRSSSTAVSGVSVQETDESPNGKKITDKKIKFQIL